jgi:hypothetical protein
MLIRGLHRRGKARLDGPRFKRQTSAKLPTQIT